MSESDKTQELLELLKYFKSEDLKNEQTQLTKTANKVRDTANGRLGALFTDDEKQTLRDAATLLTSLKTRVEHAKEIKAREEARKEKELKESLAASRAVINAAFPDSDSTTDRLDVLLWALFLGKHMVGYSGQGQNSRSRGFGWIDLLPGQLQPTLKKWFDDAETWQTRHTQNGKLVYTDQERRNSPDFMTTTAFFNELRYRVADILEDNLDNHKPGFALRFEEFLKKTEADRIALRSESTEYLAHFRERLSAAAASQQFLSAIHAKVRG